MEPISLILGALAAGAVAGAQATASEAVKDSYQGLRTLIQRKLADKPSAEIVLAKHEEKPEVWQEPLKAELIEAAADQDQAIINAAEKLMALVNQNPKQAAMGKYINQAEKIQGVVQGEQENVTLNFGNGQ
jgi:hypothetical protein